MPECMLYHSGGPKVAVEDGGTGAGSAVAARAALLPPTLGKGMQILRVNAQANDVEWTPAADGGGSVNAGLAMLSFGAFPGSTETSLAVTGQAGISDTSVVSVQVTAKATADHSADEHVIESLCVMAGDIIPGVGFTIYGSNTARGRLFGAFSVAWTWS